MASEEDLVQMLSTMFVQADKDGNGVLDKKEFKRLLLVLTPVTQCFSNQIISVLLNRILCTGCGSWIVQERYQIALRPGFACPEAFLSFCI
jgi:hypothetical protein